MMSAGAKTNGGRNCLSGTLQSLGLLFDNVWGSSLPEDRCLSHVGNELSILSKTRQSLHTLNVSNSLLRYHVNFHSILDTLVRFFMIMYAMRRENSICLTLREKSQDKKTFKAVRWLRAVPLFQQRLTISRNIMCLRCRLLTGSYEFIESGVDCECALLNFRVFLILFMFFSIFLHSFWQVGSLFFGGVIFGHFVFCEFF